MGKEIVAMILAGGRGTRLKRTYSKSRKTRQFTLGGNIVSSTFH